ncbi:MAG: AAA family ATPase, partial [Clostridia bacterium]|nr:AAA family ATPase [Clostridia bacterium]
MAKMMTIHEAAEKWGISNSRLARLCREGRIVGAEKVKKSWMIPANAEYPADGRVKASRHTARKTQLLPLPIGISDYRKASAEYYYIDKTLMIRDFLDEVPMVSLFTRPRRFGKTLNMDMLRTYFEKTGEDTSRYFANRKIWACGETYRAHQGKYPVIFLSFKDVKCRTWAETYDLIAMLISMEYKRHSELATAKNPDLDFYQKITQDKADSNDFMLSLMMLSKMLHDHHGIEPMVIIDEYDTPIQQGHSCGFYDDVVLFIRNLFSGAFKDNKHLKYGFLTGILRVAKESIFSGLNNLKINSILDNRYSEYFGFTPDEVREMAAYYGAPDKYDELCAWYDGYRFGDAEIFNPWSVINYFSNECKPGCYWLSTGSNDIIGEMLTHADEVTYHRLHSLLQGGAFNTAVDTSVIYPQIQKNPSSVYSFLLVAGYLKAEETGITPAGDLMCKVSLPNKEISFVYNKEILSKLEHIVP